MVALGKRLADGTLRFEIQVLLGANTILMMSKHCLTNGQKARNSTALCSAGRGIVHLRMDFTPD